MGEKISTISAKNNFYLKKRWLVKDACTRIFKNNLAVDFQRLNSNMLQVIRALVWRLEHALTTRKEHSCQTQQDKVLFQRHGVQNWWRYGVAHNLNVMRS